MSVLTVSLLVGVFNKTLNGTLPVTRRDENSRADRLLQLIGYARSIFKACRPSTLLLAGLNRLFILHFLFFHVGLIQNEVDNLVFKHG